VSLSYWILGEIALAVQTISPIVYLHISSWRGLSSVSFGHSASAVGFKRHLAADTFVGSSDTLC